MHYTDTLNSAEKHTDTHAHTDTYTDRQTDTYTGTDAQLTSSCLTGLLHIGQVNLYKRQDNNIQYILLSHNMTVTVVTQ